MGSLREAFDVTVRESELVLAVDSALVETGRSIADRVDLAVATCEGQEVTKALYLLPHLVNVLREMLATPAARKAAGVTPVEREISTLEVLRSAARAG